MVDEVRAEKGEQTEAAALASEPGQSDEPKNEAADQNENTNKVEKPNEEVKENTYTNLKICFICAKPATETCDICNLVGFCSEDHKKLHRPENFCFPFMVEQKEGVGRYVVATRDIEPLELVMWDNAAALGPRMGCSPACLQCLKPADGSFRCGNCNWPVCDQKCADGNAHKIECETLKNAKEKVEFTDFKEPHDTYRCIAPLRLLKVQEKIPEVSKVACELTV